MSPHRRLPPPALPSHDSGPLAPETLMMRAGYNPWWSEGAVKPPLFLTSTFLFKTAEEGEEFFQVALGKKQSQGAQGLIYSRLNNPELEIVEERLALWEGAERASVFASGMAAITTTLLALCKPGDQVAYTVPVYGGTAHFLKEMVTKFGIESFPIPAGEAAVQALESLAAPRLRFVFAETPSNPSLQLTSIRALRAATDRLSSRTGRDVILAVDNTMLGPVFQQPVRLGAHLSIYSATKFLGGHSDLIAGAVLGPAALVSEINAYRSFLGTMCSPFVCWQLMRSLETLKIRMEKQAENAQKVARFLAQHPAVGAVYFPGLLDPSSNEGALAAEQLTGPGAVLAFEVRPGRHEGLPDGAKRRAFEVLNRVRICHLAVSLGGTETLIEHPKTMTHSELDDALMASCGISDGLIRLSIGLENPDDLIGDLRHALEA